MKLFLYGLTALMLAGPAMAGDMPWDVAKLMQAPRTEPADGFATNNVRAVFFEGLPWYGRPTRVFAYIGMPEHKSGEKVPAMVLVHGGGGTAFAEWVELWNQRGYAAIAMDTCGSLPGGQHSKRPRDAKGGPPGWGGFEQGDEKPHDQWMYHAVADVILAHSLLRAQPDVDAERIGINGISWGGILTCAVSGVDDRFRLAIPAYGCGFLGDDNPVYREKFKMMGPEKTEFWLTHWDPSLYLPQAKMPFLWVDGSNDKFFPMNALQKSYRLPSGPRTLCTRLRMVHGNKPVWATEEVYVFADHILKGGPALARITAQGRNWATYESPSEIVKAELNYTKDSGTWREREWKTIPAALNPVQHKVSAVIPAGTTVYYFNITDERGLTVSTEHIETVQP